jgi:cytochrome b subunit of formate dehydrogenase
MKKETIPRFTRPELWLHWSQAALYLLLFGSGTLLLLGRILNHPLVWPASLGRLHRVAGIALVVLLGQILLLSVMAAPFRTFWRTLGQCLRWRWSDVVWLIKVPFNTITRRVTLPPAERFNAGQKLHVLVIICVLAGFSISGVLMMLLPGALGPWIAHLLCFLPAAAFLVVHLFLSLLNPETRKTLPSIFTGHMPLELARRHHGLWAGRSESGEHPSYVSLRMVLIVAALVLVPFGVLAASYGPGRTFHVVAAAVAGGGVNAISPAPLSHAHARAHGHSNAPNCDRCHLLTTPPPSEKCLVCHTRIKERIAAGSGVHGNLSGPCRQCHTEHHGDDALVSFDWQAFNHSNTNFPLDGKHQSVSCEKCHARKAGSHGTGKMKYLGLDHASCTSCHRDPHKDSRAGHCVECHTMQGWGRENLTFDHGRDSKFPLAGKHARLGCEKCHPRQVTGAQVQVRLFDVGKACQDCHADPHGRQFKASCRHCHTEQGWTGRGLASFHGPDSSFPLQGEHAHVPCDQCHRIPENGHRLADAQFVGLSRDCQSCHADPHAGQMSSSCSTCHTETGWTGNGLVFSHDRHTSFPLDKRHAGVDCAACHGRDKRRYRPLPHKCGTCHTAQQAALQGTSRVLSGSPDPHNGRLSCADCHDQSKSKQSPEEFAGRCAACHNPHYRDLFYSWMSALDNNRAAIGQILIHLQDPNDARRRQLEQMQQDAAAVGFHNLHLTREILRAGTSGSSENVK